MGYASIPPVCGMGTTVGNPACWWSWGSASEASAFYFAITSEILVERSVAIFPPTESKMLRNTSSIPSAFCLPPTKNYLTDPLNTISSAIAGWRMWVGARGEYPSVTAEP